MKNKHKKEILEGPVRVWLGLATIVFGFFVLLENLGLRMPFWLFNWSTVVILLALALGYKRNFKGKSWAILLAIGAYFKLDELFSSFNLSHILIPASLLVLGLVLIVKRPSRYKRTSAGTDEPIVGFNEGAAERSPLAAEGIGAEANEPVAPVEETEEPKAYDPTDYIESVSVFGGSNQVVYSKNFKGGEVVAVFGGGDINFTQADFKGRVVLEVTAIFGGVNIIVPSTWRVTSELAAVFGGLEDKRPIYPSSDTHPDKLIIIKGVALFGGVVLKSY